MKPHPIRQNNTQILLEEQKEFIRNYFKAYPEDLDFWINGEQHINNIIRPFRNSSTQKKKLVRDKKIEIGKCLMCEFNEKPLVLVFHHRDPKNKIDDISRMVSGPQYSIEDLIVEIEKCDLICPICHDSMHRKDNGYAV